MRQYQIWYTFIMSLKTEKPRLYHWICKHRPWHWKKDREKNFPLWVPKNKRPKVIRSSYRYIYPSITEDMADGVHWWERDHPVVRGDKGILYYAEQFSCQWHSGGYKNATGRVKARSKNPLPPISQLTVYPPEEVFGVDDLVYKDGKVLLPWSMYTLPKRLLVQGYYVKKGLVYRNDGQVLCSAMLKNSHKRYRPYGLPCINVPEVCGRCSSHGGNVAKGFSHPFYLKRLREEMEEVYGSRN